MTSWQLVRLVAGSLILLSLALGVPGSPLFVSPWFLAFTAFILNTAVGHSEPSAA